jgi:PAS domain S-box-containing protein
MNSAPPLSPTQSNADAYLAAIIDSSFDAIISKDLNSIITTWNPAAERMFGYAASEAIGRSILMLIPEQLQGEEAEIIARVRHGERVASYETTRRRKDGSTIFVSLTVSPIRAIDGVTIVGASKIARDITAAKENERRIRLLMRELNHRVKNQFAVILSVIRETKQRSGDPHEFERSVRARIVGLARSHDLLVNTEWSGADLSTLVKEQLGPFGHEERIKIAGPAVMMPANTIQPLGMAFHELGTNSAKYGALSGAGGEISVTWQLSSDDAGNRSITLVWDEICSSVDGGADEPRKGFGSVVLKRVTPDSLNGKATFERLAGRIRWILEAPITPDDGT